MLWLTERQLKSKNAAVRRKAVEQLCHAPDPRALRALRAALGDEDSEVRRLAATALGKLEDDGRIDPLRDALRDRDPGVLRAALLALRRTSDNRLVPALVPLLRHTDAGVRAQTAQTLETLGWHPPSIEAESFFHVAKGRFAEAAALGYAAIPAIESALTDGSSSLGVGAVEALGRMHGPPAMRPLLLALKASDPAVCVAAIDVLGRRGDPQAVDPLIKLLRAGNSHVRACAAEALGRMHAAAAFEAISTLLSDPVWEVRRQATEALGRLSDPRAVDPLTRALNDEDGDVRETAAIALGGLGERGAIQPLVLALKDHTSGVRRIAAAALSRIDPDWSSSPEAQAVLEELRPALQDEDAGVRHFVGHLMASLGNIEPGSGPATRSETSLIHSPDEHRKLAVSLFLTILCDVDRDLRQAAAEALGRLRDPRARAALLRAQADADPGVGAEAAQALWALGAASTES